MFCLVSPRGLRVEAAGRGLCSPALKVSSGWARSRCEQGRSSPAPPGAGGARQYQRSPSPFGVVATVNKSPRVTGSDSTAPHGTVTAGLQRGRGAAGTARIRAHSHIHREWLPEEPLHPEQCPHDSIPLFRPPENPSNCLFPPGLFPF